MAPAAARWRRSSRWGRLPGSLSLSPLGAGRGSGADRYEFEIPADAGFNSPVLGSTPTTFTKNAHADDHWKSHPEWDVLVARASGRPGWLAVAPGRRRSQEAVADHADPHGAGQRRDDHLSHAGLPASWNQVPGRSLICSAWRPIPSSGRLVVSGRRDAGNVVYAFAFAGNTRRTSKKRSPRSRRPPGRLLRGSVVQLGLASTTTTRVTDIAAGRPWRSTTTSSIGTPSRGAAGYELGAARLRGLRSWLACSRPPSIRSRSFRLSQRGNTRRPCSAEQQSLPLAQWSIRVRTQASGMSGRSSRRRLQRRPAGWATCGCSTTQHRGHLRDSDTPIVAWSKVPGALAMRLRSRSSPESGGPRRRSIGRAARRRTPGRHSGTRERHPVAHQPAERRDGHACAYFRSCVLRSSHGHRSASDHRAPLRSVERRRAPGTPIST